MTHSDAARVCEGYVLRFASGKEYVGITTAYRQRLQNHSAYARAGDTAVNRAWRKHGPPDRVVTEMLPSWDAACAWERDTICTRRARAPHGYNLTDGGDGTLGRGTPEQRSADARKREAALTQEQRSERSRRSSAAMTPEQRLARALKVHAALTPAQERERKRKIGEANRKRWAALTPAQRHARGQKTLTAKTAGTAEGGRVQGPCDETPPAAGESRGGGVVREAAAILVAVAIFAVGEHLIERLEPPFAVPPPQTALTPLTALRDTFTHPCADVVPDGLLPVFLAVTADVREDRPQLCAQVEAESSWRTDVCSPAGACGLAQFMPRTAVEQFARVGCAGVPRTDDECSLKAQRNYMTELRVGWRCATEADTWPMAQACYNAGLGWLERERRACDRARGCDPDRWAGHVSDHCLRKRPGACDETRTYVARIQALVAN